jgi:hypothetical protein
LFFFHLRHANVSPYDVIVPGIKFIRTGNLHLFEKQHRNPEHHPVAIQNAVKNANFSQFSNIEYNLTGSEYHEYLNDKEQFCFKGKVLQVKKYIDKQYSSMYKSKIILILN